MPETYNTIDSTTALAGLLTLNCVAQHDGHATNATNYHLLDALPECQALGMTDHGWRADVMLRSLYGALSPEHLALVDGELLVFDFTLWQMMTGEITSL